MAASPLWICRLLHEIMSIIMGNGSATTLCLSFSLHPPLAPITRILRQTDLTKFAPSRKFVGWRIGNSVERVKWQWIFEVCKMSADNVIHNSARETVTRRPNLCLRACACWCAATPRTCDYLSLLRLLDLPIIRCALCEFNSTKCDKKRQRRRSSRRRTLWRRKFKGIIYGEKKIIILNRWSWSKVMLSLSCGRRFVWNVFRFFFFLCICWDIAHERVHK